MKYKTINGYTKESMIAKIKERNFNRISIGMNDGCLYRSPDGNCCAIGCFIPDEKYRPEFEHGFDVGDVLAEVEDFMPLDNFGMVEFQQAHDGCPIKMHNNMHLVLENWINENVR